MTGCGTVIADTKGVRDGYIATLVGASGNDMGGPEEVADTTVAG